MIAGKITRKNKLKYIDIEKIVSGKFTVRKHFDEEGIDRLAMSIDNFGIIQPVTVRKFGKRYELISGERRILAAKRAGLVKIPVILVDTRFDIAAAMALAENQQREELYYMDEADGVMALMRRRGLTYSEMEEITGVPAGQISERVMILQLPKKIRDVLAEYNLTAEYVEAVSIIENEEEKISLLRQAGEERCSPEALALMAKIKCEEKTIRKQIVKDVKIYLNTINQAVDMIKKSGVYASAERSDNDQFIEYVIKIEK